jgi:hypothetical protein
LKAGHGNEKMAEEEQGLGVHNESPEMFSRKGGRKFQEKFPWKRNTFESLGR